MSVEEILKWFYDNPWVVFIGSIGLLLTAFWGVKQTLDWIRDIRKKPKLVFHPRPVHETIEKRNGIFYVRVNFWINVTNEGGKEAENCHAFLKFMDEDFKENIVWKSAFPQYSIDDPFGVHWHFLDTIKDVVNIPITKKSGYSIKIPFYLELLQTVGNPDWGFGDVMGWDPPVKEFNFAKVDVPKNHDLYEHVLGVVVEIIYGKNKSVKQRFLIRVPHDKKTEHFANDPWSIEFFCHNSSNMMLRLTM